MQDESSPVGTSAVQCSANTSGVPVSLRSGRLTLPLSRQLLCFAAQDVAPDNAQSLSVTTQLYPASPVSRSSTPYFDLADFDSECSRAAKSGSPVSDVAPVVPVVLVDSVPVDVVEWGVVSVAGARRGCHGFGHVRTVVFH